MAGRTQVLPNGVDTAAVRAATPYPDEPPTVLSLGRLEPYKGVATLLGILIPLLPFAALIYALGWVGLLLVARISSLAGMIAAASAPITAYLVGRIDLFPMLLGFALLVIWKHRANIARLRSGTEPRVGQKAV